MSENFESPKLRCLVDVKRKERDDCPEYEEHPVYDEEKRRENKEASMSQMTPKCAKMLSSLLAYTRALYAAYQTAHWQAKGGDGYENHLLFARLYDEMEDEIDTLAEKTVGLCGNDYVNAVPQARMFAKYMSVLNPSSGHCCKRMLRAEQILQKLLKKTYDLLEREDCLTLGLDDFIMAMASSHETAIYLLQQRLKA